MRTLIFAKFNRSFPSSTDDGSPSSLARVWLSPLNEPRARRAGPRHFHILSLIQHWASLVAQTVKSLPAVQETQV